MPVRAGPGRSYSAPKVYDVWENRTEHDVGRERSDVWEEPLIPLLTIFYRKNYNFTRPAYCLQLNGY